MYVKDMNKLLIYIVLISICAFAPAWAREPVTIRVQMVNQEVVGDVDTFRLVEGDKVTIVWESDESVELHLHGYDINAVARPGEPASLQFVAANTGRFPVTTHGFGGRSEHRHRALIYIEVYPQ